MAYRPTKRCIFCEECGDPFFTVKAFHWHLRIEHEYEPSWAFQVAGEADWHDWYGDQPDDADERSDGSWA